jgi:hypothetical protein
MILLIIGFVIFCFGYIIQELRYYENSTDELDKLSCFMKIFGIFLILMYITVNPHLIVS